MRTRSGMAVGAAALVAAGLLAGGGGSATAQEPCGGLLQPPCPEPTPTPTPTATPAEVSLTASPRRVLYNGRRSGEVRLTGRVLGSTPAAGVRVRLTGRVPAYGRSVAPHTATTDDVGRFSFVLRPQANTTYRAIIETGQELEGRSPARRVLVFPILDLASRARDRGLQISVAALGPVPLTFRRGAPVTELRRGTARRAFFYVRRRGEARYRRVGSAPLSAVVCRTVCRRRAAVVVRKVELLRRTRSVGVCVRGTVFDGFGASSPCGRARMRL